MRVMRMETLVKNLGKKKSLVLRTSLSRLYEAFHLIQKMVVIFTPVLQIGKLRF